MGDTMKLRSAIIGYAALTVLLTAGAAQGLAGTNTVTSDDIVNESILSSDIKNEQIRSSDILNGQVSVYDLSPSVPNAYYAQVDSSGNLEGGNAVDANKENSGEYTVKFSGADVRNCAWTGSEADFPGATSLINHRYVVSTDADSSSTTVTVHITGTDSGVHPNASFSLVGICP
jgi:hypothetical protein